MPIKSLNLNQISQRELHYEVFCSKLANVSSMLFDSSNERDLCSINLNFNRKTNDSVDLKGDFTIKCELLCLRCSKPLTFETHEDFAFEISREASTDGFFTANGNIDLLEIIDMIVFSGLPYHPKHDDCELLIN